VASYGIIIYPPTSLKRQLNRWLVFVRNRADARDIEFTSQVSPDEGHLRCYVGLRGSVAGLQNLERQFGQHLLVFLEGVARPEEVLAEIVVPFLKSNHAGVNEVTEAYDSLLGQLRDRKLDRGLTTTPFVVSPRVRRISLQRRPRTPAGRAIQRIVLAIDQCQSNGLPMVAAVILCDQGMEELLKVSLGPAVRPRAGFSEVVSAARAAGIVAARDAVRLIRLHNMRNRIQHRRGTLRRERAIAMFQFYFEFLNRIA
jgi:hypothetical protein